MLDNGQESTQEMVPALHTSEAAPVVVVFSLSSDNGVHQERQEILVALEGGDLIPDQVMDLSQVADECHAM